MVEPLPLPLFAWGAAELGRRAARARRARRLALGGALVAAIAVTIAAPPAPFLVWNASASAPVGLYRIAPGARLARGDYGLVRLPEAARALAAERHYLPANVPAVKRVAALAGDRICAAGVRVWIVGGVAVTRRAADARGRVLPWWNGCRTLGAGMVFLLNADVADSFDGRYFGAVGAGRIIGRATLLWAR